MVAGTITNNGTVNVDVGTTANKVLQLTSNAQIPAVDGYIVTNVNATNLSGKQIASAASADAQLLVFNGTTSKWVPGTVSGDANMTNLGALSVLKIQGNGVAAGAPGAGNILTWNGTTNLWQALTPATNGTVTAVMSGTGLVAGTITGTGTLNLDVGTAASKIVQLTAGAQYPAVDGYLVTNVNATNIFGTAVANAANDDGQLNIFNGTTN